MSSRFLSRSLDISPFGAKVRTNQRLKMGTSVRLKVVPREGSPLRVGATVWRVDADGLPFSSAVASSITSSARPINLFAQVLTRHGHAPTFTATFLGPGLALA